MELNGIVTSLLTQTMPGTSAPIGRFMYRSNVCFYSRIILSYFLNYSIRHVIKGIKNGCPCVVEIRGTSGCALATSLHSPTARSGSPVKAQPCVPLISTRHGQPFLILLQSPTKHVGTQFSNTWNKIRHLLSREWIWKCDLRKHEKTDTQMFSSYFFSGKSGYHITMTS